MANINAIRTSEHESCIRVMVRGLLQQQFSFCCMWSLSVIHRQKVQNANFFIFWISVAVYPRGCLLFCFVFKTIAINHLSVRCLYFFIVSYRKEIETQVTTGYKQGIQKNDSEHATHQTQKQMSYSNRRPYQGPII